MPFRRQDPEYWRHHFVTHPHNVDRINVNSVNMLLSSAKEWTEDVNNFGFVVIFTERHRPETLTLCSPSGHIQIFHKVGPTVYLPQEVQDILFGDDHIKKVVMYKEESQAYAEAHGMPTIKIVELRPLIKKNVVEASGATVFLKSQLGPDFRPYKTFDFANADHLRWLAHNARALSYGVWLATSKLASSAGLVEDANISQYLRTLFFQDTTGFFTDTLVDPYYVPTEQVCLTPRDQLVFDQTGAKLFDARLKATKAFRPRFEMPFAPLAPEPDLCRTCGIFQKSSRHHKCPVKPECKYPFCADKTPHTPLTCRFIRAWCERCLRRGHVAAQHDNPKYGKFVAQYVWDLFRFWSTLQLDTSFLYKPLRSQNPYFHMMSFYGVPPSVLPKAALEQGYGQDEPGLFRGPSPSPMVSPAAEPSTPPPAPVQTPVQAPAKTDSALRRPIAGRVEKTVTMTALSKACQLAQKIAKGELPSTSGTKNPVVAQLLELVDELSKEGVIPTTYNPKVIRVSRSPTKAPRTLPFPEIAAKSERQQRLFDEIFGSEPTDTPALNYEHVPDSSLLYETDDDLDPATGGVISTISSEVTHAVVPNSDDDDNSAMHVEDSSQPEEDAASMDAAPLVIVEGQVEEPAVLPDLSGSIN
jgi:hypothetical protein